MEKISTLLELVGAALLTLGVSRFSVGAALIVAGLALVAIGAAVSPPVRRPQAPEL